MVLGNEADHHTVCEDCKSVLDYGVQQSNAGYYIGTFCPHCGPYGRESGYFRTREAAKVALGLWDEGERINARPQGYQGANVDMVIIDEIALMEAAKPPVLVSWLSMARLYPEFVQRYIAKHGPIDDDDPGIDQVRYERLRAEYERGEW